MRRLPPAAGSGRRAILIAGMASCLLHLGLAGLVTWTRSRAATPPRIDVAEAIPVEIVSDPDVVRTRPAARPPLTILRAAPPLAAQTGVPPDATAQAKAIAPADLPPPIPPSPAPSPPVPAAPVRLLAIPPGPPAAPAPIPVALPALPTPAANPVAPDRLAVAPAPAAPDAVRPVAAAPDAVAPALDVPRVKPVGAPATLPPVGASTTLAPVAPAIAEGPAPPGPALAAANPAPPGQPPDAARPTFAQPAPRSPEPVAPAGRLAALGPVPLSVVAPSVPLEPPERPAQPLDPGPVITAALATFGCARIGAALDPASGTVTLTGHARSAADRVRLAVELAALPGVARVDETGLGVLGEPYCQVLGLLDRPDLRRSTQQRHDLATLGAANPPGLRRAVGGEALQLTLSAPDFDAYLYVDYFSADGGVVHLLPAERGDNRLPADTVFRLGERGRRAIIGPPYGVDVVVVIAASEPLFAAPRPAQESAAAYLPALDREITRSGTGKARFEYAYYLLSTLPP